MFIYISIVSSYYVTLWTVSLLFDHNPLPAPLKKLRIQKARVSSGAVHLPGTTSNKQTNRYEKGTVLPESKSF